MFGRISHESSEAKKLMKDWLDEATIADMQDKMSSNEITSEDLVFMYNCDE